MEDCAKPVVIKKGESPTSPSLGSPDQQKRLRKSSWDNSDDEYPFVEKNDQERTGRIYSFDKIKENYSEIQTIKELYLKSVDNNNEEKKLEHSVDLFNRRHSPARIRRRRKSSGGSSIISDNALDDQIAQEIRQVAENVIDEKMEVSNTGRRNSIIRGNATINIVQGKKVDTKNNTAKTPKTFPPVENSNDKDRKCTNSENLQGLSKNIISSMFCEKKISLNGLKSKRKDNTTKNKENIRAKSNKSENQSKDFEKLNDRLRPKSEKISGTTSITETINQEHPNSIYATVSAQNKKSSETSTKIFNIFPHLIKEMEEKKSFCETEFKTQNVPNSSRRPKSANFLIMEDLEDIKDSYMESGRKTERTKSADYRSDPTNKSSCPCNFELNKDSENSSEKSLMSGHSTVSKISDIHNSSESNIKISPKVGMDLKKWYHDSEESYRTEKSPYSETLQLISPTDSTGKSANSECLWNYSGKNDQDEMEKSESKNIEEPQDHGDGNFRVNNNGEDWEPLMSQIDDKKKLKWNPEIKKQFWSEVQEMLNNNEKRSWLSDIEEEKQKVFTDDSPKIPKSKWSLINNGCEVAKPLSSSSDASIQCNIIQDKKISKPRKRKRERCQKVNNDNFKNKNLVRQNWNTALEKKEVTLDYNEIKVCEEEVLEDPKEFLILKKTREKQTTNLKNFLSKSKDDINAQMPKNKLLTKNGIKSTLRLWGHRNKSNSISVKILRNGMDSSDPSDKKPFYHCGCFVIIFKIFRDLCGPTT